MACDSIVFEIATDMPAASLAQLWRELETRSECHFFLSWDWIGCWVAEIGQPVAVLTGRSAEQVVVLGLLVSSPRRGRLPWKIFGAELHNTGDPEKDVITMEYNGLLVARDVAGLAAEDAAIRFLLSDHPAAGRSAA